MRKFLETILGFYARLTLKLNHPSIIGITGSVGKSSTKDAIATILSSRFQVRASPGNLNSQLGLPLAILGFQKPGGFKKNISSVFSWLWILITGFFRIFQFDYPEILVLEMGSDRPGDIAYLLSITGPLKTAVITDIGISHLEHFSNPESLKREKLSLLQGLNKSGTAVLNADNPKVLDGKNSTFAKVITYGFGSADISVSDFQLTTKNGHAGSGFKINFAGNRVPFFIPNSIGKPNVYAAMAAAAVGIDFGLNLVEISQAIQKYDSPTGRQKLIEGINESQIIDDTYNAAPSSTIAALETLHLMPATRKLVSIGSMAELGSATDQGHRDVAAKIFEVNPKVVFLVGEKARIIQDELTKKGFPGKVSWFADSIQAASNVKTQILPGDVILVKGSQSARMEKIVKEIMKDPSQAKDLLVRQSKQWIS